MFCAPFKNKHVQNEYVTALQTQYPVLTLNLDVSIDESRPVLNYTLTSMDYETDELIDLNVPVRINEHRLKREQLDSNSIQINKSWQNVRPTGLEVAIQFGSE